MLKLIFLNLRLIFLTVGFISSFPIVFAEEAGMCNPNKENLKLAVNDIYKGTNDKLFLQDYDIPMGINNAKVTVIEYSSLSCPHCASFNKKTFPRIKAEYIDTGKILYIHRDFPSDRPSLRGSMLAHCAGREQYYKYHELLFGKQESWVPVKNSTEILGNFARLGGVTEIEFDKCMKDIALQEKIIRIKRDGVEALGVRATPTFFINGKKLEGALSYKDMSELIEKELNS